MNAGSLSMSASTLSANTASNGGGGVEQDGGTVTINSSTLNSNTAGWARGST